MCRSFTENLPGGVAWLTSGQRHLQHTCSFSLTHMWISVLLARGTGTGKAPPGMRGQKDAHVSTNEHMQHTVLAHEHTRHRVPANEPHLEDWP